MASFNPGQQSPPPYSQSFQDAHIGQSSYRPPLPPRPPSHFAQSSPSPAASPYGSYLYAQDQQDVPDSRSSSMTSLLPPSTAQDEFESHKRTLLCIFVHGFVGNETSFRSFPAHLHELVSVLVSETHVVHTKIYPKFKTRHDLSVSVEIFSKWLATFELPTTDIVLLGHSMGGLIIADVVLLHPFPPGRHKILGTVSFDTPFMGIHPGVVKSGLASIFRPPEKPVDQPGFRPPNTQLEVAPLPSGWESSLHFLSKHQGNLWQGSMSYITSHLEFGQSMVEIQEMKNRYDKIRGLEKVNEDDRRNAMHFGRNTHVNRTRFINYYTRSTGRPKKPKEENTQQAGHMLQTDENTVPQVDSRRGSVELFHDPASTMQSTDAPTDNDLVEQTSTLTLLDPLPIDDDTNTQGAKTPDLVLTTTNTGISAINDSSFISPSTVSFASLDTSATTDTQASGTTSPEDAEKAAAKALKESIKTQQKAAKEAEKAHQKQLKAEAKAREKAHKELRKAQEKAEKAEQKRIAKLQPKLHTFCVIPDKEDPTWIPVMMEGVDEVGAHCGLFFMSETYEKLIGDVAVRIESWVGERMDEIAVRDGEF